MFLNEKEKVVAYRNKVFSQFYNLRYHSLRKPDFLILGTQKGGTTSLYDYISQHPEVISNHEKELHFFNYKSKYNLGLGKYKSYFLNNSNSLICGESTPEYLYYKEVPKRCFNYLPKIKLIVLLRNPIQRAYSNFQMEVARGNEILSFKEAVFLESKRIIKDYLSRKTFSYVKRGEYIDQLNNWLQYFPRNQMLIIKSEDFFDNPKETIQSVFQFLEISDSFEPEVLIKNKGNYTKIEVDTETLEYLEEYYYHFNMKLQKEYKISWDE